MAHRTVAVPALVFVVLTAGCFAPGAFANQSPDTEPRFREVGAEAGFNYTASYIASFGNGRAGVFVTDFNNDHRPDVLAIGGSEPALFENTGGAFERTDKLPPLDMWVKGALFVDYDTDGWEDLLLLPVNGTAVLLENSNGTFHQRDVGFRTKMHMATGASAADYNQDGCLDVFVIQSGDWRTGVPRAASAAQAGDGANESDTGNSNLLFEGNCKSFDRVEDAGITGTRWSLVTSFVDLTGDDYPDIHVGNDFNRDILYVNQQDGTFERRELPDTDRHAMSSEVADVNGDMRPDVFVTNVRFNQRSRVQQKMPTMDNTGNNLLINRGNGRFSSDEAVYGVREGGWGWAATIVDLDNDGGRDLVHATKKYLKDSDDLGNTTNVPTRPRIWKRTGRNFTRLDASEVGFEPSDSRGLARMDYDLDGDQDLVVAAHTGTFKLYENRVGDGRNWLQIEIRGDGTPTVGSRVYVTSGNETQSRIRNTRADFLSQDARTLHFGLGDHETVTVRVDWSSGTQHTLHGVTVNQRLVMSRNGSVESVGVGKSVTVNRAYSMKLSATTYISMENDIEQSVLPPQVIVAPNHPEYGDYAGNRSGSLSGRGHLAVRHFRDASQDRSEGA